ncbi:MAG TPA: polysaccharide biosynthesis/export family protein, partial [Steroidobacteraceae bacterium]|nr:polysaccharide biosynthesis/export family protein [Steroidobacteraceae bacterium]
MPSNHVRAVACVAAIALSSCTSILPTIGPSRHDIEHAKRQPNPGAIEIIDINDELAHTLLAQRQQRLFSETLAGTPANPRTVGPGDVLEVSIWEAAPPTLFTTNTTIGVMSTSHAVMLPEQTIDDEGDIMVPFAGRVPASGKTVEAIEREIVDRLAKKANQPEVLVQRTHNASANATVVGEVTTSTRVPLQSGSEHLLDALAAAGGVKQPVNKTTIQVTRANSVYSLPLETIIRDPRQNIALVPGDVVTALFQPYSFTALGATGRVDEVNFETQGITLAQALARANGLIDARSNAKGVFVFRLEPPNALTWPHPPKYTTPQGLVPTVFRIDMTDPQSLFLIQDFWIENRDILYVSNAP